MKNIKLLFPYIGRHKTRIILGLITVTISNIISVIIPSYLGSIVDMFSSESYSHNVVMNNIYIILLLTALSGFFMLITRIAVVGASRIIEYELRNDFLNAIERKNIHFFSKHSSGEIMAFATNDITASREFIGPAVMFGLNSISMFCFALYFMLSLDTEITLMALIPLPFISIFTYLISRKVHIQYRKVQDHFAVLSDTAQENFSGIKVIKTFDKHENEIQNFESLSNEYRLKNLKLAKYQALTMPTIMFLVASSLLLILSFGGWKVINGEATIGQLTQFFVYINMLIWPVAALGWITNIIQRASASAARLKNILEDEDLYKENNDGNETIESTEIKIDELNFAFPDRNRNALTDINLSIEEKQHIGICGKIGSGKSTLVNILVGLYDDYSGNIDISNKNLRKISKVSLRDTIAFVPQNPFLFSDTIIENLKFASDNLNEEEIITTCKILNIHDEIMEFPDGYDTILGERGISLSGGQIQRLAIARALLRRPKILIMDDSLSAVDSNTENKIMNNLNNATEKISLIIISHRLNIISSADKILYMEDGKIIESGTHEELIKSKYKYYEMYKRQQLEAEIGLI